MEKIKIGKIVNAVALRGEVKVYNYSDYKERYEELDEVYVEDRVFAIESVRYHQHMVILKLKGIDNRTQAEKMKDQNIFITENDLRQLPDDTYYVRDLIGMDVIDWETGQSIGVIADVLQNTAQDIYKVKLTKGGDGMIPAVKEFVKEIDMHDRCVKVKLIEGMID